MDIQQSNGEEERTAFAFLRAKWEEGTTGNENACVGSQKFHLLDENACVGSPKLHLDLDMLHNNACVSSGTKKQFQENTSEGTTASASESASSEGSGRDSGIEVHMKELIEDLSHKMELQLLQTSTSDDDVITLTPVITPVQSEDISLATTKASNSTIQKRISVRNRKIQRSLSNDTVTNENVPPPIKHSSLKQLNNYKASTSAPRNKAVLQSRSSAAQKGVYDRIYQVVLEKNRPRSTGRMNLTSGSNIHELSSNDIPLQVQKSSSYAGAEERKKRPGITKSASLTSVMTASSSELQEVKPERPRRTRTQRRGARTRAKSRPPIYERLYGKSKALQEEGKQRREKIAEAAAKRKEIPDFSDNTIPLSQADNYYKKSIKEMAERERRLEQKKLEAEKEREKDIIILKETIPLSHAADFYQKSMKKAHAMEERIHDKRAANSKREDAEMIHSGGIISRSRACDFYKKSVKRAIAEETKRAKMAEEKKVIYEPLYKFNQ